MCSFPLAGVRPKIADALGSFRIAPEHEPVPPGALPQIVHCLTPRFGRASLDSSTRITVREVPPLDF